MSILSIACVSFQIFSCFYKKLKRGMVTLTVRTSQRSPSPAFTTPTLASCSSFSTSNSSGITLVRFGIKGGNSYEGPSQGGDVPKTSIMTEGTLHKGQLTAGHLLASTFDTSETFSIQTFGVATKHTFTVKKSVKITKII